LSICSKWHSASRDLDTDGLFTQNGFLQAAVWTEMTDDELHVAYAALFETYQEITPTAAAFPVGKLNAPYAPSAVAMDADRHEYRPAADNPIFATMERRYGRSNRI